MSAVGESTTPVRGNCGFMEQWYIGLVLCMNFKLLSSISSLDFMNACAKSLNNPIFIHLCCRPTDSFLNNVFVSKKIILLLKGS